MCSTWPRYVTLYVARWNTVIFPMVMFLVYVYNYIKLYDVVKFH